MRFMFWASSYRVAAYCCSSEKGKAVVRRDLHETSDCLQAAAFTAEFAENSAEIAEVIVDSDVEVGVLRLRKDGRYALILAPLSMTA